MEKVVGLSALIMFEFIMIHSGLFMAVMPAKFSLFILVPFYGLFAFVLNKAVSDNSVVILYLAVVFNRMRFAFFNIDTKVLGQMILKSILAFGLYFILCLIILPLSNYLPTFALTDSFMQRAYEAGFFKSKGTFSFVPQATMCLGTIYYVLLPILEYKFIKKYNKQLLSADNEIAPNKLK
jgi:hypothetical protein